MQNKETSPQDIVKVKRPHAVVLSNVKKVVEEKERQAIEKPEMLMDSGVLPTQVPILRDQDNTMTQFSEIQNKKRAKKQKVNTTYSVEKDYPGGMISINKGYWNHKVMIGTPTTGVARMEWVLARYGQVIPTNWSMLDSYVPLPFMFAPMKYLVPDAQNLIVGNVIKQKVEWLFLVETDNVLPPDCFVRMNEYMRKADIPVVSGLYFTKSVPPEPMIYRGLGNSFYRDWKLGERVWCTGVPTGCVIIHHSILKTLWDESPEYSVQGQLTRRVFEAPAEVWYDPQTAGYRTNVGTSDLNFCHKLMTKDIFKKAGWAKYQDMENPFLVDTNMFVKHIDMDGRMFPLEVPPEYLPAVSPRDNQ